MALSFPTAAARSTRFRWAASSSRPSVPLTGTPFWTAVRAALGLVDKEEVGFRFQRQRDGFALAQAKLGETRGVLGGAHLGSGRGRHGPLSDNCRRPRVQELTVNRRREEQGSVEGASEIDVTDQDQVVHWPRVRDHDHRLGGSKALSWASSALVLIGYGTR